MNNLKEIGRKRIYRMEIRLDEMENSKLTYDSLKAEISKAELIRNLIINNEVKSKPDREFYDVMNNLSKMYIRINQLVSLAKENNYIDTDELKKQEKVWKEFVNKIEDKYL